MRIVVLAKEVPDTYGDRRLHPETGLAERPSSEAVLDEICERALEVALAHADAHDDVEVVLVSMAPESATPTLRRGLAMGADRAIHVVDEELSGADVQLTAETLAAAIRRDSFDLVLAGDASTDGAGGMVPAALAEFLEAPHLTGLASVEISEAAVAGSRPVDGGVQRVSAPLPAVVSVTEALPSARFPSFKGIIAAKKKPLETVTLSALGVSADVRETARSIMLAVAERPPRAAGVRIADEGDAGERLAEFLLENRLV